MTPFWIALQFLTILPAPRRLVFSERAQAASLLYYPLVGLIVGGLLYGAALLAPLHLSPLLSAALLLLLWVGITGALHLDGLADMADGWLGGVGDRERTLAIMKDPCSGPAATTAVVLALLLKLAAVEQLLANSERGLEWLLLAPLLARSSVVVLMLTTPYVRAGGIAAPLLTAPPLLRALAVVAVVVVGALTLFGYTATAPLAMAGLLLGLMRYLSLRRLGGFTGDVAGALIESTEVVVLLGLAFAFGA